MAQLRAPGGCPWDRKQTFDSVKPYTLEETYEVLDAIDARDWEGLREELGDFLLQAVFYAEMAADEGLFTIGDSLDAINEKLVRRHPHVFGSGTAETPEDVKQRWDEIKAGEKAGREKEEDGSSVLDGVPRSLPALMEAEKVSRKAAEQGFDWPSTEGVLEKLVEEARELVAAREAGAAAAGAGREDGYAAVEHEVGDLLFTLVNLARKLKVDPEQALRKTTGRFRRRYRHVERGVAAKGGVATLEEMEEFWGTGKRVEIG